MTPKKKVPEAIEIKPNPWWKGDLVKYPLPYFAHEVMDPAMYGESKGTRNDRATYCPSDGLTE